MLVLIDATDHVHHHDRRRSSERFRRRCTAARHYLGTWGILVASLLAGFVDVDAITLSLSGMSARGMPVETAAGGIAVAVLANTAAKAGYAAWRGSSDYKRGVALILGASFVAGLIAMILLGLRPQG